MHGFSSILCNVDEGLSINPSANVFVFEDFNVHHWNFHWGGGGIAGDETSNRKQNFRIIKKSFMSYIINYLSNYTFL